MTLYCTQCLLAYKGNDSMYEHLTALDPHGNKTARCPQCAVVVPNFEEFVSHIEQTTHLKIPESDGLVASDSMSKLLGVSAFTTKGCPYCGIQFPDDPRLDQLYEHTLAEHFCRWCRTRHPSRESRDRHYHTKHTVCTSCKQPFATTSSLRDHQAQHQAIFPGCLQVPAHHRYRCLSCWKSIHGLDALVRHRGLHRADKRYGCEDCDVKGSANDIREHVLATKHMQYQRPNSSSTTSD
jgi:hypothetical protein